LTRIRQEHRPWLTLYTGQRRGYSASGHLSFAWENIMPARLQQQLQELRQQLTKEPPLNDAERTELAALIVEIDQQLLLGTSSTPNASLTDGVNLAVERFENDHPTLAATLRNIVQSLANMGI
jgi:hypothetical protein